LYGLGGKIDGGRNIRHLTNPIGGASKQKLLINLAAESAHCGASIFIERAIEKHVFFTSFVNINGDVHRQNQADICRHLSLVV
ncbi:hypothetical protein, partial [Vibrio cholerae]|uniref:hypothetical protein n=1 Tax=Vibrio cholerae TaxID=666 RepID=UPI00226FCB28